MQNNNKLVLTGGHAGSTAYALIKKIIEKEPELQLHWIGNATALQGSNVKTFESSVLPKLGVQFHEILAGKLQTKFTRYTIISFLKIPLGFVHAFILLKKISPSAVLSFGGFSAVPVVLTAWLMRIPIIIHEQTIVYGRANKFSAAFADVIALSRKESLQYFPKNKCVITGNPVSEEVLTVKPKTELGNPPVIFATGGSRGSVPLNEVINDSLEEILADYSFIHQTGEYQFQKFYEKRQGLPDSLKERYQVYGMLSRDEFKEALSRADIVIARAGANTVSEVIIAKRPTLFVPLPFAFKNEQLLNAEFAEKFGIAIILEQKNLDRLSFIKSINTLHNNWKKMVNNVAEKESPDVKAAENLADIVLKVFQ